MIDYTAKPGQSDAAIIRCVTAIALPICNRYHGSTYSEFDVTLTGRSGAVAARFVIHMNAAVAIEEAGYAIRLVGRDNTDNVAA